MEPRDVVMHLSKYPPTGLRYSYRHIRSPHPNPANHLVDLQAEDYYDESSRFTFTATATASYSVDDYRFIITVEAGSDRVTVDEGTIKILSDLPNANVEQRTHAQIVLDKIETLLQGKADSDVANYSINNRSLTKMSPDELLKWRDYYKAEVLREKRIERAKSGQGSGNRILVGF